LRQSVAFGHELRHARIGCGHRFATVAGVELALEALAYRLEELLA